MVKYICSLLVVDDIEKSRFLYENILEQKVKSDYGENITFEGDFAIHKKAHFRSLIGEKKMIKGSHHFELYFETENIELIYKKILDNRLEILHSVQEQPWKQKVFRFYDYDSNMIEIGEKLEYTAYRLWKENYSIEDIIRYTYLQEDEISEALKKYS